jgi:hypothetical protein
MGLEDPVTLLQPNRALPMSSNAPICMLMCLWRLFVTEHKVYPIKYVQTYQKCVQWATLPLQITALTLVRHSDFKKRMKFAVCQLLL